MMVVVFRRPSALISSLWRLWPVISSPLSPFFSFSVVFLKQQQYTSQIYSSIWIHDNEPSSPSGEQQLRQGTETATDLLPRSSLITCSNSLPTTRRWHCRFDPVRSATLQPRQQRSHRTLPDFVSSSPMSTTAGESASLITVIHNSSLFLRLWWTDLKFEYPKISRLQ